MFGVLIEIRNRDLPNKGQNCYSLNQSGRCLNLMLYRACNKVNSVLNRSVDLVAKWISVTHRFMYVILIFQMAGQPRAISVMISFGSLCRCESSYKIRIACDLSVTRSHSVVSMLSLSTSSTLKHSSNVYDFLTGFGRSILNL